MSNHVVLSGQVRPRQGTDICNFGVPSPLEALHWMFCFFSSIYVQFSKTSPLKSGESSEKSSGANRVKSCHVCGCHGFFSPDSGALSTPVFKKSFREFGLKCPRAECTPKSRDSLRPRRRFLPLPQNIARFFGAPRCAQSSAKKIASEPRFLLRRKRVKMVLVAEFPAIPSSAVKIASERRCATLVHSVPEGPKIDARLKKSRFQYQNELFPTRMVSSIRPISGRRENKGPILKVSIKNETFKQRMAFSIENVFFLRGAMAFSSDRARIIFFGSLVFCSVLLFFGWKSKENFSKAPQERGL